jgi:4-oxalocrotonate tautomerase
MPLVQIKLIEGVFSKDQKSQMINKVTDAMLSIEGESLRGVTSVIIEEVKSGDWSIGGKLIEADEIKAKVSERTQQRKTA